MKQKRGIVLIVIVILFIVQVSVIVIGSHDVPEQDATSHLVHKYAFSHEERHETCVSYSISENPGFIHSVWCRGGIREAGDCDEHDWEELPGNFPYSNHGGIKGCFVSLVDDDDVSSDCYWAAIRVGEVIGVTYERRLDISDTQVGDGWDAFGAGVGAELTLLGGRERICADDEYWYGCNENNVFDPSLLQPNGVINIPSDTRNAIARGVFEFTDPNLNPDPDADPDSGDEEETKIVLCLQSGDIYRWMNVEELDLQVDRDGDEVPDVADCAPDDDKIYPAFACTELEETEIVRDETGAPIGSTLDCVVPAPAEICGDNIDNDCNEDTGAESDDCDEDQFACENNCLEEGKLCNWINGEENNCCGDDGIEDLGDQAYAQESGGNALCVNKNLVGTVGDITQLSWGTEQTPCDNWCWVNAVGNAAFHILTIKKPTEPAYDVVSNNDDWIECKTAGANREISTSGITNPDDVENANLFHCYQEGNHWSWAECQDQDENIATPNNGMKERAPGDGLFGLKIEQTIADEMAATGREYLFIDLEQSFSPFYGTSRIDFSGFDPLYFEFLVRFKNIEEDSIPQLQLKIYGPEQEGERIIYYDQLVLGYAVNTPLLEANRWMQVKVPLPPELLDVEAVKIESTIPGNLMEVRNIYLSSGESPLCSGTRSREPGDSSWIQDLDFSSSASTI